MRRFAKIILCLVIGVNAYAQTPEQRGLEIAQEADRRDLGFGDSRADMIMVLKNKQGQSSTRKLHVKTLEQRHDGDKSLTIFNHPKDVKGTALLTFTHKRDTDDQWLYLPALKRVKRIASKNKSGPFMGSEFAYEDMASQEVEKYRYRYIQNEACGAQKCFKIERYPVDKFSGYTRQLVWIDTQEYRVMKVEFFDRKNTLLKTLEFSDYQQFLGQYWRAMNMAMKNHQTHKSTDLKWSNYRFKTGLKDSDFNKNSLKRVR